MKIHHAELVRRFHVTFDPDEAKKLSAHPQFQHWVRLNHGNEGQLARHSRPTAGGVLTVSQMQQIAMFLDIDYRFVNERAQQVIDGADVPARPLPVGVQKADAESKVDRLKMGAPPPGGVPLTW